MQNGSSGSRGYTRPNPMKSSYERCSPSRILPRCSSTRRGWKSIVPGGDRRVRREDRHRGHVTHHLAKGQPRPPSSANHLHRRKRAVALVKVQHRGIDPQRMQGPHAADAEEQLLANSDPGVTSIEARREFPV